MELSRRGNKKTIFRKLSNIEPPPTEENKNLENENKDLIFNKNKEEV